MTGEPMIVCVDDEQAILDVVQRCLRKLPYQIRTTLSASEALVWISKDPVAVLVSDYEMPEMTGAQLAGQVKRLRPETVRILLTGRRTFETVVDGINQGEIFRFIAKPFVPQELRDAVAAAIVRHEELSGLSIDRNRGERRDALREALEQEHPGITSVAIARDGAYEISDDILALAHQLGFDR